MRRQAGTDTLERVPATPVAPEGGAFTGTPTRRAWRLVAAREMVVKLHDRGFFISTAVTLALILAAIGVQAYVGVSQERITVATTGAGSERTVEYAVALADRAGQDVEISREAMPDEAAVETAVRAGKVDVGLVPAGDGWRLLGRTDREEAAAVWIGAAVRQLALERNAAEAGTSVAELERGAAVEYRLLAEGDTPEMVVRISTFVFGFLFYLAAVLFGVAISTSVVEEKQNRIVEIIASAIPLRSLLIGKVVGNSLLALAQLVLFLGGGLAGLAAMGQADVLDQVSAGTGWFAVFFVFGFALLACVYAATGAISTRTADIQATTTPVSATVAVVFIAGISVSGAVQTVLSFVPLTSAITMPARIVAGETSWWEPALSLAITAMTAGVVILVGERIYRRALMQTGRRLSFRQALRLPE